MYIFDHVKEEIKMKFKRKSIVGLLVAMGIVFAGIGFVYAQTAADADFDGDGVVGVEDFLLFVARFGSSQGDGRYEAKYDLDGDGTIGVSDYLAFVNLIGQTVTSTGSVETDRSALIALYNATDGANWNDNHNWLSDKPLNQWHGVTTDTQGRVVELDLGDNDLSGPIPPEIGNLTDLTRLELRSNQLTGTIPESFSNLRKLKSIYLQNNQLVGTIPVSVCLNIGKSSPLPDNLTFEADLTICVPDDSALDHFAYLHHPARCSSADRAVLIELYNATDGPNWLNNTNWLSYLPLSSWDRVTPTYIVGLDYRNKSIEALNLQNNSLSGVLPASLGNLTDLEILRLGDNRLTGPIPSTLGNLKSLKELELDGNQHSGRIPPELGKLTNLEILNLDDNQFSGPIPSTLGNLTKIERLDLTGNQISGSIPSTLGNLKNLTYLDLHGLQLTGRIPPELGDLTNLESLDLSRNNLSGQVPVSLKKLGKLTSLYLAGGIGIEPQPPMNENLCLPSELDNWVNSIEYTDAYHLSACTDNSDVPTDSLHSITLPGGVLVEMEMVWIEPGTFQMGSTDKEWRAESDEMPEHTVTISQGFFLGKYEVTEGQWNSVTIPPYLRSLMPGSIFVSREPEVERWEAVQAFIRSLNSAVGSDVYRLPTEAEWEYACRAGTSTLWSFGDDVSQLRHYAVYRPESTQIVGTKLPNPWGLYDMHGNVAEWVQDYYDSNYYSYSPSVDPAGPSSGSYRVVRGSDSIPHAHYVRSRSRSFRKTVAGFRLLRQVQ